MAKSVMGEYPDTESSAVTEDSRGDCTPVEWLATGRAKRSSAGNRMTSILALEEPDSDLELLFAEDGDDDGFSDSEDAVSDMQMDSSSDSEDENGGDADDLEGERELEKQAKERRGRKRKAEESIPAKFRKKVRINGHQPTKIRESSRPALRARKKSERVSWLPAATDLPTRASARQTTILSKEHLHLQMMEREAKRLRQVAAMERKARRMEAVKKPPLTQAQRLAEAAVVEERNSKSLSRWEEAEKAREDERRTKLAALNNRTLKGPVVTFWSGMGIWEGDESDGKAVSIEERPRRKREKKDKENQGNGSPTDDKASISDDAAITGSNPMPAANAGDHPKTQSISTLSGTNQPGIKILKGTDASTETQGASRLRAPPVSASSSTTHAPVLERPNCQVAAMDLPALPPQSTKASLAIVTRPSSVPPLQGLKAPVLAPPVLAPPPGGIHLPGTAIAPMSNVLAPPNAIQRPSPPSVHSVTGSEDQPPLAKLVFPNSHSGLSAAQPRPPETTPPTSQNPTSHPQLLSAASPRSEQRLSDRRPGDPSAGSKTTRHAIVLQDFDETLIRDKMSQLQVLFGQRKLSKLPKPPPATLCAITNHPARYRDARTGLPYFNSYAYRELQRLRRGDYRFGALIGAWVGSGSYAAKGVPERFLDGLGPRGRQDADTKDNLPKRTIAGTGSTASGSENNKGGEGSYTIKQSSGREMKTDLLVGETGKPQDNPKATALAADTRLPRCQASGAPVVPGDSPAVSFTTKGETARTSVNSRHRQE
ncbi:hypothetical protein ACRALDRAFT_1063511 [Sodiomyces alcalophilus JCM 7366]|uniref:uncharacterized protein n=1 Tax=Sodiomyces alcalophilus JCM 7366 TaxID=591952 RepID=UPI0039B4E432